MLVKEETLAHVLTLQKPYSLLSLFLIGDCFEHGKRQEETDDKERTRREKKKAQGETSEEVASIAVHLCDKRPVRPWRIVCNGRGSFWSGKSEKSVIND
jgi:hypothetical protein